MSRATVEAAEENIAPVVVAEAGRRLKCPRPDPMAAEVTAAADIARAEVAVTAEAEVVVAALLPAEAAVAVPGAAGIGSEISEAG